MNSPDGYPKTGNIISNKISIDIDAGRYEEALSIAEKACARFPDVRIYKELLRKCRHLCGGVDGAIKTQGNTRDESSHEADSLDYHMRETLKAVRRGSVSPIDAMHRLRCIAPDHWPQDPRLTKILGLNGSIPENAPFRESESEHLIVTGDIRGGAGIAANRIYQCLNSIGTKTDILFRDNEKYIIKDHTGATTEIITHDTSPLHYGGIDYLLIEEMRSYISAEIHKCLADKSRGSNTFLFHTEETIDISPIAASYQSINIHWSDFLLTAPSLELLKGVDIPIIVTLHDMYWLTGTCHYSASCDQYKTECTACPLTTRSSKPITLYNSYHIATLQSIRRLFFIAPSLWLCDACKSSPAGRGRDVFYIKNPQVDKHLGENRQMPEFTDTGVGPLNIIYGALGLEEKRKGYSLFVEVVRKSLAEGLGVRYRVFGNISDRQAQELEGLGCAVLGFLNHSELVHYFRLSDAMLLLTYEDNYPNLCVEAASCGLPIICSSNTGLSSLVRECQGGVLVNNNTDSIIDSLAGIKKEDLRGFSDRISEWYHKHYSTPELEEGYKSVLRVDSDRYRFLHSGLEPDKRGQDSSFNITGNMKEQISCYSEYVVEAEVCSHAAWQNNLVSIFCTPVNSPERIQLYVDGEPYPNQPRIQCNGATIAFHGIRAGSRVKILSCDDASHYYYAHHGIRGIDCAPDSLSGLDSPTESVGNRKRAGGAVSPFFILAGDSINLEKYEGETVYWLLGNSVNIVHAHAGIVDIGAMYKFTFCALNIRMEPLRKCILRAYTEDRYTDYKPDADGSDIVFMVSGKDLHGHSLIQLLSFEGEELPDGRSVVALIRSHILQVVA